MVAQPHACAAAVLIDEFDAGALQGAVGSHLRWRASFLGVGPCQLRCLAGSPQGPLAANSASARPICGLEPRAALHLPCG